MNKQKYIHVKVKSVREKLKKGPRVKHKPKSLDDFESLPSFTAMRNCNVDRWDWTCYGTQLNFWNIGEQYLKSKIGQCWDDIYSDMIKKTKPKYRYLLEQYIEMKRLIPIYYEDEIPYGKFYWRHNGMMIDKFYIDREGILQYFETEEEMLDYAKYQRRLKKLERILNYDEE